MKKGSRTKRVLAFFLIFAMLSGSIETTAFAAGSDMDPGVSYMSGNQGWMSSDEGVYKTTHLVAYAISEDYVRVYKGDSTEMKVYAYTRDDEGKSLGSKGISYQWYKKLVDREDMSPDQMSPDQMEDTNHDKVDVTGDEPLLGETSTTLKFENVSDEVAGAYYVVVTDDTTGEQVKVSYSLGVKSIDLSINFKESTYEKSIGDSFTMELQSSTNKLSNLTYKWYFKAKKSQEWTEIAGWDKSFYQIDALTKNQLGYYMVEATNSNGDTDVAQARVKTPDDYQDGYFNLCGRCPEERVDYIDEDTSHYYGSQSAYRYVGDSITMEGVIDQYGSNSDVMRNYTYAWAKYDSDTDSYLSITGADEISYYIASLKDEDFGEYRLTATCGKYSKNFYFYLNQSVWSEYDGDVQAYVKGWRYNASRNIEKKIGESTKLEVATLCRNGIKESDLTYQWYLPEQNGDGVWTEIPGATKSYLNLENLKAADFGRYECVVSYKDTEGTQKGTTVSFSLQEKNPIRINQYARTQYAYEGGNATFSISADVYEGEEIDGEQLLYQWYRQNSDGEWEKINQDDAQTNTLHLSDVSFGEESTNIYCKVKVSYGKFEKVDTCWLYKLTTPFSFDGEDNYNSQTEISGRKVFAASLGKPVDLMVPLIINSEFTSVEGNQITCQWYDSNDEGDYVEMEGQTGTTLHLDSVNADDYHTFYCEVTATDSTGETQMIGRYYCDLMRSQFYVDSGSYPNDYQVGDTVTLPVLVNERNADGASKRSYTYQWYRYVDGDTDQNDIPYGYYELLGYSGDTYTYQTTPKDDWSLEFLCLVSDGETTQSQYFWINRKNTLTTSINGTNNYYDVVANAGDAVDFTVNAESTLGQDKISYQWYRYNEEIAGATGSTLHIDSVAEDDYGRYECKVSDGNDTEELVAYINHEAEKEVDDDYLYAYAGGTEKEDEVELDAYPGDDLAFEVITKAPKNSKLTYQWYKNGNPITGATESTYQTEVEFDSSNSAGFDRTDNYWCEVTDGEQTAKVNYDVSVKNKGNIGVVLYYATVAPGQTYNWKCEANTQNPNGKLSYQWYRLYYDDEILLDCTGDTLTITPTTENDYGTYFCRVTDGYETAITSSYIEPFEVSATITVDDQEPVTTDTVVVKEGQKVTLEGVVAGSDNSAYTYLWEKWDEEKQEFVTVGSDKTFVISSADEKTVGEFLVTIFDGEICNSVWMSVGLEQDQPIPVSITSDAIEIDDDGDTYEKTEFTIGNQVTYTASTDVDFDVTYQWYHDGRAIKGATKSTYTVDIEDQSQAGYYSVSVEGNKRIGSSNSKYIRLNSNVRILSGYYNTLILQDNSTVDLKVDAVGDGDLNYQWYKMVQSSSNGSKQPIPLEGQNSNILTTTFKTEDLQNQSSVQYMCRVYTENDSTWTYAYYELRNHYDYYGDDDDDDDDSQNTIVVNPSYTERYQVLKGESKTLSVEASSKTGAALTYQWYRRETVEIVGGFDEYDSWKGVFNAIPGATSPNYTVNNVEADGDYYCIISDGTYSRSANFEVQVIEEEKIITQFPYQVEATYEGDGTISNYYCYQYAGEDKDKVRGLRVRVAGLTSNCSENYLVVYDEEGNGRQFDQSDIDYYEDNYEKVYPGYFDYTVEGTSLRIRVHADDCDGDSISAVIESITPVYDLYDDDDENTFYAVTYMDGSEAMTMADSVSKYEQDKGLVLPAATKSGYVFGGWYKNPELTGSRVSRISTTATGDKTFYAKWLVNPKTVKSVDIQTTAPVAGRVLPGIQSESEDYEVASAKWYEKVYGYEQTYASGDTVYYAKVILEAADNTVFSDDATAKIAGNNATVKVSADRRQLTATYTFPKTGEIVYNVGYNYDKAVCAVSGPSTAKQNGAIAFDIQLKSGYENYRVKVNGTTVQADENGKVHYTANVYGDVTYTIDVTKQQISKLTITTDDVVANQILPTTASIPKGANYQVSSIQWKDAADNSVVIADLGEKYTYTMNVKADNWAEFTQAVKATVNGKDASCELQADGSCVVSGTVSTGYQLTFTQGENYKVTDVKGATITKLGVAEGEKAYFKVVPDEGIAKENVVVKLGNTVLTPNEQGVYTIESVTENAKVTIKINAVAITDVELTLDAPKAGSQVDKMGVADGDTYTAKVDWGADKATFEYGTAYTPSITLKPAAGYAFTKDTAVQLNGKKVIARNKKLNLNGSYEITGKEMHTENQIAFNVPEGYGVTTTSGTEITGNKADVGYGDSYQFKITGLQEGKKLIVKANGEYLTPLDAIYTIENITGDVQVVVKEEVTNDSSTSSVFARFFDLFSVENPTGAKDEGLVDTIEVKNNSWIARNDVDNTLPILASDETKTFIGWYQEKDANGNGIGDWFTKATTMDKTQDVYARWTDTVFTGTYRGKTVTYEIIKVLPDRRLQLRIKSVADISKKSALKAASRNNLVAAQSDSLTPVATGELADAIEGMEVTEIAANAFEGCDLDSVEIPNTVTSIGADAFKDCTNLTSVEIPDSVSTLAAGTFDGCTNLETVVLPDTIEEIDEQAFGTNNDNLTVVANSDTASLVPANVKTETVDVAFYSEENEGAIQAKVYQVGASDTLVLSQKNQNQYEAIAGNEVTWSYPQDATGFTFVVADDGNLKVTATGETKTPVTVKATYKGQSDSIALTAEKSTYDKSVISVVKGLNECVDANGKVDLTKATNYPVDAQEVSAKLKDGFEAKDVNVTVSGTSVTYAVKAGSIAKGAYVDVPVVISSATYNDIEAVVRLQADYHVEFSDGGVGISGKPAVPQITEGSITLPNWARNGYTFEGWKSSVDEKVYATGTKVSIAEDSNYTFTAQWKKIPVNIKVSFDSQGGSSVAAKTVQEGAAYGTLTTPTRTGYTFEGWFTAKSGGTKVSESTKAGTQNVTLYAHWRVNTYTVSFNKNGGDNPSANSIKVAYGSAYGKLATVKRKGYTFDGWYTAKSGGSKISDKTVMGAGNVTVYAHWKKVSKPKTTSISSLKNGKKSFTVSFKKVKDAKGYEVRYSTNSKLKSAKTVTTKSTKATIKKLKSKKKYYVQVRAYKLDSKNKKVYGSWSKTKNVKTK